MSDPSPMGMLDKRQDRLEARLRVVEDEAEEMTAWKEGIATEMREWKAAINKEVGHLHEGFNRNTNAMYQVGIGIVTAGVLGLLTALVLKGVIG